MSSIHAICYFFMCFSHSMSILYCHELHSSHRFIILPCLCRRTISPRGYHQPSSQCFCTDIVYLLDIFIFEIYYSCINITKSKFHLPQVKVTVGEFDYCVGFIAPKLLHFLAFQSFDTK